MTDTVIPVITVDGPSGSGKGTLGQWLAQHLGWHFLDSGAVEILACSRSCVGLLPWRRGLISSCALAWPLRQAAWLEFSPSM